MYWSCAFVLPPPVSLHNQIFVFRVAGPTATTATGSNRPALAQAAAAGGGGGKQGQQLPATAAGSSMVAAAGSSSHAAAGDAAAGTQSGPASPSNDSCVDHDEEQDGGSEEDAELPPGTLLLAGQEYTAWLHHPSHMMSAAELQAAIDKSGPEYVPVAKRGRGKQQQQKKKTNQQQRRKRHQGARIAAAAALCPNDIKYNSDAMIAHLRGGR